MFTDFILNVPVGLLTIQKLYCLIEIIHSDLFTQHGEWDPGNHSVVTVFMAYGPVPSLLLAERSRGCSPLKKLHHRPGGFGPR